MNQRIQKPPRPSVESNRPPARNIGIWFNLATDFFRQVLGGIASRINELEGWRLTVIAESSRADWLRKSSGGMPELDAIIAVVTDPGQLAMANHLSPMLVNISNRYFYPEVAQVSSDEEMVGQLAAQHFLERKIRNFGYYGAADLNFSEERENAFGASIRRSGGKVSVFYRSSDYQAECGWLRGLPKPCGILCMNDHFARRLIDAALACDLSIPNEISILGVDDDALENSLSAVPISSVNLDSLGIGRRVVNLLDAHLRTGAELPHRVRVPPLCVNSRQSSDFYHIPDPLVVRALKHMHDRVETVASVKALAEALNVHRRTLEMHFKAMTGESVRTSLLRARIKRSQILLATTDLPVSEVMEKSGFNNPRAFSMAFRRITGTTPSLLRKQSRSFGDHA
jgi:LacI family transcriptional regulator